MEVRTLVYLAVSLIVVYATKKFVDKVKLPAVTGYVIVGVLAGYSMLNFLSQKVINNFSIVSDLALGIIAFSIGVELNRETLSKLGKSIFFIAFFEAFTAFLFVTLVTYLIDPSALYRALIFGSIASATAPAATVYVIQQYKAKGPLTSTVLAVVGIDDAIALTIYVFASLFATSILTGTHLSVAKIIITPLIKITLSLILGGSVAFLYYVIFRKIRLQDELTIGIAASILLVMGVAEYFKLSELLAVMTLGAVLANINPMLANRSQRTIEYFSPIFLPLFFMFAGARLNIRLISKIGVLGLIYTAARFSGKIIGASVGAFLGKAPKVVKKFTGFSLLPQVGVAIALSLAVQKKFGTGTYGKAGVDMATTIINLLLFTTIITEIIGPLLTRFSLGRAGEISMKD
ncbi:MAG: cation:proton antiporter [Spirochaetes bacterium]|nr:cation:proton antiporter [Spirochaetota bacterium]